MSSLTDESHHASGQHAEHTSAHCFKMDQMHFLSIFITTFLLCSGGDLPGTDRPVGPDHPFLFMWNAPTELCDIRFGMPLDLSYFQMVSSTLKSATNQSISIFYTDRFGIFPHIDEDEPHTVHNGGLPQLIDLQGHLKKAKDDIEYYIPPDQPGLAVLAFVEWRPLWIRNWGKMDIYRNRSIEAVLKNGSLSLEEADARAETEFEEGAMRFFLESIRIGKRLRPNRLWGYYLYPDCYNYDYNQDMAGYTGECPGIEKDRNDQLLWLWRESTALYPNILLEKKLKDSLQARNFIRHRIQEAMRVSSLPNSSYSIPIYPFIRPVYKDSVDDYMSELDLVNTIGEAAALGAAGIISWGDMNVADTEDSCTDAQRHLDEVMNPYILNVSIAACLCSEAICQGQGRCVRKHWDSDVYLHLDPRCNQIQRTFPGGPLTVSASFLQDDIDRFDRNFDCMCYSEKPCRSVLKEMNPLKCFNMWV